MESKDLMSIPQLLLFDCPDDLHTALTEHHFSVTRASFGKDVKVDFDGEREIFVPLYLEVPSNVHEFEIFVVDMRGVCDAIGIEDIPEYYKSSVQYRLQAPTDIFYTSAISSKYAFFKDEKPKKAVYIVFEGDLVFSNHKTHNIVDRTYSEEGGSTFDFFRNICKYSITTNRRIGKRTVILDETRLGSILLKYNESFRYWLRLSIPQIMIRN